MIPFLMGFNPQSSLVIVAADAAAVVRTAARLDLPTTAEAPAQLLLALEQTAALIDAHGGTWAILAGYGPIAQVDVAISAATGALDGRGIQVRDAVRVADDRFWQLNRDDRTPCPPEGTLFDPTNSPAVASAVYAGLVALPDREALVATLAPVTGAAQQAMAAATAAACVVLSELIDAAAPAARQSCGTFSDTPVGRIVQAAAQTYLADAYHSYQTRYPVDDEPAAALTVLLDLPALRDFAARHTTGDAWQIEMWTDLVRRAAREFTSTPAILLALCALHAGNGALADIAARRARDADPDDRLAHLLASAIMAGIDPKAIIELFD
jgi:hypothetical protein